MKSKPLKHKKTNTFRFIPFSERINTIDIRHAALYHIEHANADKPEENETHFSVALRKWNTLNLTENYHNFRKEVSRIVTVPQLLLKKDHVLEKLEQYLLLEDPLCRQALLEILVSVAKDLRDEFYPHFPTFLDILIKLLHTKDADQLEETFICLAFLFKTLRSYMKRDISAVLKRIVPLLSDGQPTYVNNFAAESFAFVARDVRDKRKFLQLILSHLQNHEDAVTGCGHLIFEILKGVAGKFHSCAETFLPILIDQLKETQYQELLFQILTQAVSDMLYSISPKESELFWNTIIKALSDNLNNDVKDEKFVEYILKLSGQALEYKSVQFIENHSHFVMVLIKIMSQEESEAILEVCSKIATLFLLSTNVKLSQEHAGIIMKMLLPVPYPKVLINFVLNVVDYAQFDMLVLPSFINFVVNSNFNKDSMNALARICLKKAGLSRNGINLFDWVKYPLDFGKGLNRFSEIVKDLFSHDIEKIVVDPSQYLSFLICLPHVKNINVEDSVSILNGVINKILTMLENCEIECKPSINVKERDTAKIRKLLFLLSSAIESSVHILNCKKIEDVCNIDSILKTLLPFAANPEYLSALHILDLYLTAYDQENGMKCPFLSLIDSYLKENLHSPYHAVRLLTTHIYKLFENTDELKKTVIVGKNTEKLEIFSLCFSIESILPSVKDYRNQVNMLQKMAFNSVQQTLIKDTDFKNHALIYMFGTLYFNFKLLWEPTSEFISAFANGMALDEFWPIFFKILEKSFDNVMNHHVYTFSEEFESDCDVFKELYSNYNDIDERPDFYNYRNLLLQTMNNFVHVCETKNRDVIPLFLRFIDEEYRKNDKMNALKTNVELHETTEMEITESADQDVEESNILSSNIEESVSGKIVFKTLLNMMQVLSKFKNPRALHKESIFCDLFMEFLCHKNAALQKFALECILNYRNKSVTPYKDNLLNMVDDKKYKDELTAFKITKDSNAIQNEHRTEVMPIVLRILYGKMTSKSSTDKKSGGQTKRSFIMRNLAGCNDEELTEFVEMAFVFFKPYMFMEPQEIIKSVRENLNLKSIVSPSKLHSMLNLLEVIRQYFGGYMKDALLKKLFKILYAIICMCNEILTQSDKVHVGYIKIMKNLRAISLGFIGKLFEQFDKYEWSTDEIELIFETLIWPLLPKLTIEGIHSPTLLLKLFSTWAQNPRYYVLLMTCHRDQKNLSPLPYIFQLLSSGKAHVSVVNVIMDIIEKLLTLQDSDEENKPPSIESFSVLEINNLGTVDNNIEINLGSKLLIPHVPCILEVIKKRVTNNSKATTVNKRDLFILSRITELVTEEKLGEELLHLLLPILIKKICMNMAEENMEHAINTITNLIKKSSNPEVYIKKIAILFNKIGPVQIRKLLLKLLQLIADRSSSNKEAIIQMNKIIHEMNAFNARWIEQPDFDRRLDAYKEIYKLANEDQINIDLAILIANNCFYFIKTEKDISLKDSAAYCLKTILPKLFLKYKSFPDGPVFIKDTVLSLISSGIRDGKNENLRHESLSILGELVRECPDADVVLSDLAPLTNKEDREVDFFDNIVHLQMHRRVRALLKFSKVARKMNKFPTARTLTNFILPLATMYLCDDKYTDKNTLIDACIEVVATSCRLLPWYHYEVILKQYLNKMRHTTEHQKQLTRILIGILDAFHFDLSKVGKLDIPTEISTNVVKKTPQKKKNETSDVNNIVISEERKGDNEDSNDETLGDENEHIDEDGEEDNEAENDDKIEISGALKETDNDLITNQDKPAFERITIVSPSVGKRIVRSLTSVLIPQLNRSIAKLTDHEESHKVNRRRTGLERQEEDILKVPIALALVKLLQRLPTDLLTVHLPGIITKLCSFLKSPLKQVRIAARDTVKKIMLTIGTSYLNILLEHMTILLTRGFQVHVLVATIHTVLDALKNDFKKSEIDTNLQYILDVCMNDLFGSLSEEKEVEKLGHKTPEAKPSMKSYVTLTIVAQNVSESSLIDILMPLKDVLQKHHSKKIVNKVEEALKHIAVGLVNNKFIEIESLFIFLHGVTNESIPELVVGLPKREISEKQRELMLRAKPDCFIIPEEPKRNRETQMKNVKLSSKANAHVIVEFGLNMLYVILKRDKLSKKDYVPFLDPLIGLIVDSLKSNHIRVSTVALKCFIAIWTLKLVTPALKDHVKEVADAIFVILHKYATLEIASQDDNFHLVRNAFKAITVLVRNVKYYTLETDQLKTLLLYAEEDCQNDDKQANSFALIKAILDAQLVSTELHEVMHKIATIAIQSESARSRTEARQIFATYLTTYALGKKIEKHLQFFLSQLQYEMLHGRESALRFIQTIIGKLPKNTLNKNSGFLMLSLGASMVSDSAPECRALAAHCIEEMLRTRIRHKCDNGELFALALKFFEHPELGNNELAAQICTRFVITELADFKDRLPLILPAVTDKLLYLTLGDPEGRFVRLRLTEEIDENTQRQKDHCLIQVLNLVENMCLHCPEIFDEKFSADLDQISQQCQVLLGYPHAWVRLKAAKILCKVLDNLDVECLKNGFQPGEHRGFIYEDVETRVRSLVLDLCAQYCIGVTKEMADEVSAAMFLIIRLVQSLPIFALNGTRTDSEDEASNKVNLRWILFRLRKSINVEVAKAPTATNIRTSILSMLTHVISTLDKETIERVIDTIMVTLVRELTTTDPGLINVRQLAARIGKKLRRKIGDVEYNKLVADAQTKLNVKRAERKKVILQEKVSNPEKAAKRKLHIKGRKKEFKKMKMDILKGKRPKARKRKAEDIEIEEEFV